MVLWRPAIREPGVLVVGFARASDDVLHMRDPASPSRPPWHSSIVAVLIGRVAAFVRNLRARVALRAPSTDGGDHHDGVAGHGRVRRRDTSPNTSRPWPPRDRRASLHRCDDRGAV